MLPLKVERARGVVEVVRLPRYPRPLRPRPRPPLRPPPRPPAVSLLGTAVAGMTVSLIIGGVSWVLEMMEGDQKVVLVERCFRQALRKRSSFF